jgi:hypothetical protein
VIESNGGEIHEVRRPIEVNGIELGEYEINGECYATVNGLAVEMPYREVYMLALERRIKYVNGRPCILPAEAK